MSAPVATLLMTTEELLAMPEDDMDRMLIRGLLWEEPMTEHNPAHSGTEAILAFLLVSWLRLQPQPRGRVLAGEVRFRLRRNPDTTVGIDLAYISPELAANTTDDAPFVDGAPVLAVEILSPSNTQKRMLAKVKEYLGAGVQLVWAVEPEFRTVTVYRPHAEPELFNVKQHLEGSPHLPGLRIAVADIFNF